MRALTWIDRDLLMALAEPVESVQEPLPLGQADDLRLYLNAIVIEGDGGIDCIGFQLVEALCHILIAVQKMKLNEVSYNGGQVGLEHTHTS